MRLPAPLLRLKKDVHKNTFGHVLILAGSRSMLGAASLTSLAAIRSGAGLASLGIPKSLNATVQKKISNVIMTVPLVETREQTLALSCLKQIRNMYKKFDAIAIGPGLSTHTGTQKLIREVIQTSPVPLVIDADALTALSGHLNILTATRTMKVLTPHPGEMARLTGKTKSAIEASRRKAASDFSKKYRCVLLLKGHETVISSPDGKVYINKTGNPGMATAGSGDVLTGMIAAFIAQGLTGFEAAKYGAFLHGKAGDAAAAARSKLAMIASDIIDSIPKAVRSCH